MSRREDTHAPDRHEKSDTTPGSLRGELGEGSRHGLKGLWWVLLDRLERSRRLRIGLAAGGAAALLAAGGLAWGLPWWQQRNAVRNARAWLEAGRLDNAGPALRLALDRAAADPESWALAAEYAGRLGQLSQSLEYARRAAALAPADGALGVDLAARALVAGQLDEAARALGALPASVRAGDPRALRVAGDLARRQGRLDEACDHFTAAIRIEGHIPQDEIPLAEVWLLSTDATLRQRALELLARWAPHPEVGPLALRALLNDALRLDDRPGLARWAPLLRNHPRCTLGDIPLVLRSLSRSNPAEFEATVANFARHYAADPTSAAQLIGWLNEVGRHDSALAFAGQLSPAFRQQPPVSVVLCESLRAAGDWQALLALAEAREWTKDTEFLRQAFLLRGALALHQTPRADEARKALQSLVRLNPAHGLFAADTLYVWNEHDEAVALLWLIADDRSLGAQALATLTRHFQSVGDAEGQYQTFRRLRSLQPQDADISNNFAFFALLLGKEENLAARLARENYEREPAKPAYLATHAFALVCQGMTSEAARLLAPVPEAEQDNAFKFAKGVLLARTGDKPQARLLLSSLPRQDMSRQEISFITNLLGN
jgi:Tfp pilus assembly protein PilF